MQKTALLVVFAGIILGLGIYLLFARSESALVAQKATQEEEIPVTKQPVTPTVNTASVPPAFEQTDCPNFTDPEELLKQQGVVNIAETYVRFKNCIYANGKADPTPWVALMPADADTFQVINYVLTKDKNHVFHIYFTNMSAVGRVEEVAGADPTTFSTLNDYYAKDKNRIYHYAANYASAKAVVGADVQTFSVRTPAEAEDWDAQDKNFKYLKGVKVE